MQNLAILDTAIRTDEEGRYCLNDCHKASGADKKNGPSYWLANDQSQALIVELTYTGNPVSPVSVKRGGANQGTYVCKELVYAYAMWISPSFNLQVIRAFDALTTGKIAEPNPKRTRKPAIGSTFSQFMRIAAYLPLDENQRILAAARGTYNTTGTNPLELMGITSITAPVNDQHYTPTQLGEFVGLSGMKMNAKLAANGLQTRVGNTWKMTEKGRGFARIFDTTRKNGKGSQEQLKWLKGVLDVLA